MWYSRNSRLEQGNWKGVLKKLLTFIVKNLPKRSFLLKKNTIVGVSNEFYKFFKAAEHLWTATSHIDYKTWFCKNELILIMPDRFQRSTHGINLTFSWRRSLTYRNQSTDFHSKSMDWFLYDRDLRHERVNFSFNKYSSIFCGNNDRSAKWKRESRNYWVFFDNDVLFPIGNNILIKHLVTNPCKILMKWNIPEAFGVLCTK